MQASSHFSILILLFVLVLSESRATMQTLCKVTKDGQRCGEVLLPTYICVFAIRFEKDLLCGGSCRERGFDYFLGARSILMGPFGSARVCIYEKQSKEKRMSLPKALFGSVKRILLK